MSFCVSPDPYNRDPAGLMSGCGGIGIRAGFRIQCPKGRGGSTPLSRNGFDPQSRADLFDAIMDGMTGGDWIRPGELQGMRRAEVVRRPRKTPGEKLYGNYSYAMAA